MRYSIALVITAFVFVWAVSEWGGWDRQAGNVVEREAAPDVVYVDNTDPRMKLATSQARSTVGQFIQALNQPKPSQEGFSVKVAIRESDATEHMWLDPVRHHQGKFIGELGNDPETVTTVKLGDEITVKKDEISDWMYVEDGKLVGGYTIRALRDSMPERKRRELDASLPFKIE